MLSQAPVVCVGSVRQLRPEWSQACSDSRGQAQDEYLFICAIEKTCAVQNVSDFDFCAGFVPSQH